MKTFASSIANLGCPECETVQSVWLARTTYQPRVPFGFAVNKFFLCTKCALRLHLVSRGRVLPLMVGRLTALVFNMAVIFGLFIAILSLSIGPWSLALATVAFLGVANLWALCLDGLFVRNFYSLERSL